MHCVAACIAHVHAERFSTGAVGVGQISHCKLADFGITRVGVLGQGLLPIPHGIAQFGGVAEKVVQPNFGNAVDVTNALLAFEICVALQAALKGGDDLGLAQPRGARPTHRQDEGEAKTHVVIAVELLDSFELLQRAVSQASLALLVAGFGRQALVHHGLAGQLRVGSYQCELWFHASRAQYTGHRVFELGQAGKWALGQRSLRNPRRVFVQAGQQAGSFL